MSISGAIDVNVSGSKAGASRGTTAVATQNYPLPNFQIVQ
jgi:hypothetical protein